MGRFLTSPKTPWILSLVLSGLLIALAVLQHRWTGELSRAEREGKAAALAQGLDAIALQMDRQLTAIAWTLLLPGPEGGRGAANQDGLQAEVQKGWQRWIDADLSPEWIEALYLASTPRRGTNDEEPASLLALHAPDGTWQAEDWPEALRELRTAALLARRFHPQLRRSGMAEHAAMQAVFAEVPALLLPLWDVHLQRRPGPPQQSLIVHLDRRAIEATLADLAAENLPGRANSLEFSLRLVNSADEVLWSHGPALADARPPVDGQVPLFGLRSPDTFLQRGDPLTGDSLFRAPNSDFDDASEDRNVPSEDTVGAAPQDTRRTERGLLRRLAGRRAPAFRMRTLMGLTTASREGAWRLLATHGAGSLDAAVEAARRRNLWISSGISALLVLSLGLLLLSTRRAQRTARQQLEFVAGVTHELMTPLAALRSAGENLADGVVSEPEQVKRYGRLVDREGRRLSSMVGQILELAGLQSGHRALHLETVNLETVIDGALEDCRLDFESHDFAVQRLRAASLPTIQADAESLRRALVNVMQNALKYAAAGGELHIQTSSTGQWLEVELTDRGPGIDPADLPHLFEAFRRGRAMAASNLPGSGLGLSLVQSIVEAHGGEIRASNHLDANGEMAGARFVLRLPLTASPRSPA